MPRSLVTPDRLDRPSAGTLLDRLFPPLPTGVHWNLSRTRKALAELGDPHLEYATIHIGGTNGKGSVASTVHAVLDEASGVGPLRAGLYTSPHLCSVTERFQIGGGPVPEATLLGHAAEVKDAVLGHGLTFFEAVSVLAFHTFAREGAEVVVAEVGLGGRLDATNVVEPVVTGITNVALDHAEYLGDTLPEIAREKAGIIKAGVPVVVAESDPVLAELFARIAGERGAPFSSVGWDELRLLELGEDHTAFTITTETWGELRISTPLLGRHQAMNAALAVRLLEALPVDLRPDRGQLLKGIESVWWPGRDQVEKRGDTTWLFDVAHNAAGVSSLVDTLDGLAFQEPVVALVAALGDKNWAAMLPPIVERTERVVLTQAPVAPLGRRWDLADVEPAVMPFADRAGCRVDVIEEFGDALAEVERAGSGGTVVVTGSVYTVGGALRALGFPPWPAR